MANASLQEQLSRLRKNDPLEKFRQLKSPAFLEGDGVDHINIWESAETQLGRSLSLGYRIPFVHNIFGRFCSIRTYWLFIRSVNKEDAIRYLDGESFDKYYRTFKINTHVDNYRAAAMCIVTGKQIGRASCRERVSSPV